MVIDDGHPPKRGEVRDECQRLDTAWESAINIMENLSEEFLRQGDRYNRRKLGREIEELEDEFTEAQNRAQEHLDKTKAVSTNSADMDKTKAESSNLDETTFSEEQGKRSKDDEIGMKARVDSRDLVYFSDCSKTSHVDAKIRHDDIPPRKYVPAPKPSVLWSFKRTCILINGKDMPWRKLLKASRHSSVFG